MTNRRLVQNLLVLVCLYATSPVYGNNMELNKRHSGYNSNESNWANFLDCWRVKLVAFDDETNHGLLRFSNHQLPSKSKEQTSVVNPALPTSVIDFYKAYKKLGGLYRDETINDGIGIFAPQEIQPLTLYCSRPHSHHTFDQIIHHTI